MPDLSGMIYVLYMGLGALAGLILSIPFWVVSIWVPEFAQWAVIPAPVLSLAGLFAAIIQR